ncbi:hypothetical protein [Brevibacterium litoralis]|uniref:hypothetical protein n=1 Tax=Brevibacterium litoralis TaxID=3138935 RepID=UPI0032ED74A6
MPGRHDSRDPRSAAVLRERHLLLLNAEVEASDVIALVTNRLPDLPDPQVLHEAEHVGDGLWVPEVRQWRLSRHSTLEGPFDLDRTTVRELGLGDDISGVYSLSAPHDREPGPPPPWLVDPDLLHLFYPGGMPNRDEGRQIALLIALARRLHTGVRFADEPLYPDGAPPSPRRRGRHAAPDPVESGTAGAEGQGASAADEIPLRILVPDPGARIDLYVYSPLWIAPDVLYDRLHRVSAAVTFPQAALDALDAGAELDGYAIDLPLTALGPRAGALEVRVMEETALPPIVRRLLPPAPGTDAAEAPSRVVYHVHWSDAEDARYRSDPDAEFRRLRLAAAVRLEKVAAAVLAASGGMVLDEDGFLVSPGQLPEV